MYVNVNNTNCTEYWKRTAYRAMIRMVDIKFLCRDCKLEYLWHAVPTSASVYGGIDHSV